MFEFVIMITSQHEITLLLIHGVFQIAVLLGSPIKAYGEVSGRGRRNHMR